MKKFIALALALVMLCCTAAGCSSGSGEDTVMTVNGTAVGFDEYMAGLNQAVSELEDLYQSYSGTSVDWDGKFMFDDSITNIEWCLKRAAQQAARYRVVEVKANELGLTLTEDQQSAIDEQLESIKEQYVTSDDDSDTQQSFHRALRRSGQQAQRREGSGLRRGKRLHHLRAHSVPDDGDRHRRGRHNELAGYLRRAEGREKGQGRGAVRRAQCHHR